MKLTRPRVFNRQPATLLGSFLALFSFLPAIAVAETVTLELSNRQQMEVDLLRVAGSSILWRLDETDPNTQTMPISRIAAIQFPRTAAWLEAENAYRFGNLEEALTRFKAIANNKSQNYYPVPGNLASLAQLEIIECHRRMLDAEMVAKQAAIVARESKTLPPNRRQVPPLTQCWVAIGRKDWEGALKFAGNVTAAGTEVGYLKGLALQELGRPLEALDAFTETYTLSFGTQPELSQDALRRSALILANLEDKNRLPELQAQLKIYQELFGAGKLWDGISPELADLAKAELETLEGGMSKKSQNPAIPPLPELPPKDGRDWLLALEITPSAYVVGKGAFASEESVVPTRLGNALAFSGEQRMWRGGIRLRDQGIRIRTIFIPETTDGVIANVGKKGSGFALFLKGGQAMFAWSDSGERVTTYPLGAVEIGKSNTVTLTVNPNKQVASRAAGGELKKHGALPGLIRLVQPLTATLGASGNEGNATGQELPSFQGVIRHFSLGVSKDMAKINEDEKAMFEGKRIVMGVPKS